MTGATSPNASAAVDPDVAELQRRTFDWFRDVTPIETGLTPDRWPTESFCSVAAVGSALTVWPIAVERGWMGREEALTRTLNTLRFFHDAPQGDAQAGMTGHKGFFYHFLDMETGHRFRNTELSSVDTSLFLGGALFAARWFDREDPREAEVRRLAQAIYDRVEWPFMQVYGDSYISMGWRPENGFIPAKWEGYNEAMIVILMALGSPTHPVGPEAWTTWTSTYDRLSWTDRWGQPHLHFAPLFGHQYSHMWVDFRGIMDPYMRARGFDYFENSRRAAFAQQKYAADNPNGLAGYSNEVWGLTACDGPGDFVQTIDGRERQFFSYSARGPGERDDGTLAPTAAIGSMPFAPEIVIPCLKAMKARYGEAIYTRYGFLDSFNPTLTETSRDLLHGAIQPGVGWVADDYLGIDQGPIVIMTENHLTGLVWERMRGEPNLRRGLERAGFTGGWLDQAA
ncbi:glucoamylase family protein [Brevundimonas lutea]|uniref:glucoamylase family protein n=1 Tax=Brevundimonas lutea TaxID=2293980 RepID=UPI000F02AE4E|nr:glucoamylase family protein [Brevundimonas lutea]